MTFMITLNFEGAVKNLKNLIYHLVQTILTRLVKAAVQAVVHKVKTHQTISIHKKENQKLKAHQSKNLIHITTSKNVSKIESKVIATEIRMNKTAILTKTTNMMMK